MQHVINVATDALPYVAGAYEVIARSLPTKKNCTIIGNVLSILLKLSNFFDNRKTDK